MVSTAGRVGDFAWNGACQWLRPGRGASRYLGNDRRQVVVREGMSRDSPVAEPEWPLLERGEGEVDNGAA